MQGPVRAVSADVIGPQSKLICRAIDHETAIEIAHAINNFGPLLEACRAAAEHLHWCVDNSSASEPTVLRAIEDATGQPFRIG